MIITNFWDFRTVFSGGAALDNAGYPGWRADHVQPADPPITSWQVQFPVSITVNDNAADAVSGVDEWDWYLQEPCELVDFSAKRLELQDWPNDGTGTHSGRKRLALTAVGAAFVTVQDPRTMSALFSGVYLFARQTNMVTPAIYVFDIHRAVFAPESHSA